MSLFRAAADAMGKQAADMATAAADADIVLCTLSTVPLAVPVAEARGVSCIVVPLQIVEPTTEFGPTFLGGRNLGGWLNRAVPSLVGRLGTKAFAGLVKGVRADLGLPKQVGDGYRPRELPILHAVSPSVVPQPNDWRSDVRTVGYCWPPRPSNWHPPSDLVQFLSAGPPPVYFGFGSVGEGKAEHLAHAIIDAIDRTGHRALVQRGWAGLELIHDRALMIDEVPHDWLFPQVAAVVHHAGAGTTAAGLRFGIPAVPVPFVHDQPFWARRLVSLGAAPCAIPQKRLRGDRLADAIDSAIDDPRYKLAATDIANRIQHEDGAAEIVHFINTLVPAQP